MSKKTQEKKPKENCITAFGTLKPRAMCQGNKAFEDGVSEIQFKIEYFCCLPDLKKCLE